MSESDSGTVIKLNGLNCFKGELECLQKSEAMSKISFIHYLTFKHVWYFNGLLFINF